MTTRRFISLMNGLGYRLARGDDAEPTYDPVEDPPPLSSKEDIKRFFGGAIRVDRGDG